MVKHYFMEPDSQAFLILDVLKSDSITVIATDEHGTEVGVDVPAIQGIVGAGVKVKPGGASNSSITFSGRSRSPSASSSTKSSSRTGNGR